MLAPCMFFLPHHLMGSTKICVERFSLKITETLPSSSFRGAIVCEKREREKEREKGQGELEGELEGGGGNGEGALVIASLDRAK